jgi:hypothetical protein
MDIVDDFWNATVDQIRGNGIVKLTHFNIT